MTTNYANNTMENSEPIRTQTFEELCAIWDSQQRYQAKHSRFKSGRTKRSLTRFEQYNQWAHLGRIVRYRDYRFTYFEGMGLTLYPDGRKVWGTCLSEFIATVEQAYNVRIKWAHENKF